MTDELIVKRLLIRLAQIRTEIITLKKTHEGSLSLRCMSLNDQCDLLEDILDIARSHPRATQEDR